MAFEVRGANPEANGAPVIGRFTDEEWWNMTALAHECGFDTGRNHERLVYPAAGDTNELDIRLAQQLYIGVNVILNQDVLPFATTWDSDDGQIHFRWVKTPEYGRDYAPSDQTESGEGSEFRVSSSALESLMEYLVREPVRIHHVAPER